MTALPVPTAHLTRALIDANDLIDCHFLGKQMNSMVLERRRNASSIVLNETTIWVTGGHASEDEDFIFEDLECSQNEIATNCQQFEALHFLFVFAIQHVFPSVIMFNTEVIRS